MSKLCLFAARREEEHDECLVVRYAMRVHVLLSDCNLSMYGHGRELTLASVLDQVRSWSGDAGAEKILYL
jgi:hypothetical protein